MQGHKSVDDSRGDICGSLNVSICSLNEASESPEHHSAPSGEEKTNQGSKRRVKKQLFSKWNTFKSFVRCLYMMNKASWRDEVIQAKRTTWIRSYTDI